MSALEETRSIERQQFFGGQQLLAPDLQRVEQFNREMRWLHNRSLHQPGIGDGYAVTGRRGDRTVVVGAGYAVDDLGREIVLTGSRTVPVPPVSGDAAGDALRFVLTVQYPLDEELEEVELRAGVCGTRGAVRLREEAVFCWVELTPEGNPVGEADDILTGRQIVLAEAAVKDCKLDRDISIAQRRNARPPTQPRIDCGLLQPQWAPWNPWTGGPGTAVLPDLLRARFRVIGGLTATIGTSTAGFGAVPTYFARVDGPRAMPVVVVDGPVVINLVEAAGAPTTVPVVLEPRLSVAEAKATAFEARVTVLAFPMPDGPDTVPLDDLLTWAQQNWKVAWMGVEA